MELLLYRHRTSSLYTTVYFLADNGWIVGTVK